MQQTENTLFPWEGGLVFNNEEGTFADTGDCSTRGGSYLHPEQKKVIVHMYVNLDMIPEDIAAHIPSSRTDEPARVHPHYDEYPVSLGTPGPHRVTGETKS